MAKVNGRELTLDMLLTVEKEEAYSHHLIADVLAKYDYLPTTEKSFIKRLFEGTIERRMEMDYYINRFSTLPVSKMKPLIRNLLRMSVYQIYYMDGVRDAAAIDEAVKLAGKRKFANLKGFVNGVLRKIAASKGTVALPEKEDDTAYLSVRYSMPEWLVAHFLSAFSEEKTERLLESMQKVRPLTIRFAKKVTEGEKESILKDLQNRAIKVRQHPFVKEAYYLENCDHISLLPAFIEGKFTVMDAGSMEIVRQAGIRPGDYVADLCAAPGGKAILAAEYAGEGGFVDARDVSEGKVEKILENAARMQIANLSAKVFNATVLDESLLEKADVVLCDVPCSGLGVMGRKRDIKYRLKPETMNSLPALQKQILTCAVRYLKKGGILLYSTCTLNRAENEEMAAYIQKELHLTTECEKTLYPDEYDTDGFFYARFRKEM